MFKVRNNIQNAWRLIGIGTIIGSETVKNLHQFWVVEIFFVRLMHSGKQFKPWYGQNGFEDGK